MGNKISIHRSTPSSRGSNAKEQPTRAQKLSVAGSTWSSSGRNEADTPKRAQEFNVTGSTSSGNDVTDQPESVTMNSMTGNPAHDDIIRKSGLWWYPYEEFKNVEYVTSGGFSSIYKATWTDSGGTVALKCMKGSRELSEELLTEVSVVLFTG